LALPAGVHVIDAALVGSGDELVVLTDSEVIRYALGKREVVQTARWKHGVADPVRAWVGAAGELVVMGGKQGGCAVFDLNSGLPEYAFTGKVDNRLDCWDVAPGPSGRLATIWMYGDGTVVIWDCVRRVLVSRAVRPPLAVSGAALVGDRIELVDEAGVVHELSTTAPGPAVVVPGGSALAAALVGAKAARGESRDHAFAIQPHGAAADGVSVLNRASRQTTVVAVRGAVVAAGFAPSGHRLAVVTDDGLVRLMDCQ
jgi:hypothetical protein